jgi:hypothetical protein
MKVLQLTLSRADLNANYSGRSGNLQKESCVPHDNSDSFVFTLQMKKPRVVWSPWLIKFRTGRVWRQIQNSDLWGSIHSSARFHPLSALGGSICFSHQLIPRGSEKQGPLPQGSGSSPLLQMEIVPWSCFSISSCLTFLHMSFVEDYCNTFLERSWV